MTTNDQRIPVRLQPVVRRHRPMRFETGMRVMVFDPRLFVDDIKTPLSLTMQPATVLQRYRYDGQEVIDVKFDRDGRESKCHFTIGVEHMPPND